jgi:dihydroorotate dehydrogenase (NAD+) catalytic subunit
LNVVARVELSQVLELAPALARAGASAVSLAPPRGALPEPDGVLFSGRLYGPAVFPQSLYAVKELVRAGVPVIAGGGVYSPADVKALLAAGALAVQLDTALWRGDWFERGA